MLLKRITAFGTGAVAAGAALIGAAIVLGTTAMPSGDAVAAGGGNIVCVGPDSILRVPPSGHQDCPAGSRRLELEGPDHTARNLGCSGCDPWQDKPAADAAAVNSRLDRLERRIDELEQASLFQVVDKSGRKVLTVGPEVMALYNGHEFATDVVRATAEGGYLLSQSDDGELSVSVGIKGQVGGLRIFDEGRLRVDLGRQPAGNDALRFLGPMGTIAGIGESRAGSGVALINDSEGQMRASLQMANDKGTVGIFGSDGTAILSLTEGATGGGLLVIGDTSGEPMVKMGVNKGAYGAVLTGPLAGFPYVPRSGLPGSYFFGCAAGPACRP